MQKCHEFIAAAHEKGYTLWQMQYSCDNSAGFHARFMNGEKNIEVVTFDEQVQKALVQFNDK